jgi:hypothetical protein
MRWWGVSAGSSVRMVISHATMRTADRAGVDAFGPVLGGASGLAQEVQDVGAVGAGERDVLLRFPSSMIGSIGSIGSSRRAMVVKPWRGSAVESSECSQPSRVRSSGWAGGWGQEEALVVQALFPGRGCT